MKKWGIGAVVLSIIVLSCFGVLAAFSYKSQNLTDVYSGGEYVSGTINISFSNENAHSIVTSNFKGNITLLDLLKNNNFIEGRDYNCSRAGCGIDYEKIADITASGIDIEEGSAKVIGFELKSPEQIDDLTKIRFSIASNAAKSCDRQIIADILDLGERFVQNSKNSGELCGDEIIGCFDSEASSDLAELGNSLYCENMTLPAAPAFKIGANVRNGTANANVKMSLYDFDMNSLGECTLPKNTQAIEKLGCVINYSLTDEKNMLVCISSDNEDSGYAIEMEQETPNCGTSVQGPPFNKDYNFFAQSMKFDAVGTMEINETTFEAINFGESLAGYASSYIGEKYQGNCSRGCIIPFKISGIDQHLNFGNVELKYVAGGQKGISSKIYALQKKDALLTSKTLTVDIGKAGFQIPITSNATKLYLYLNGNSILTNPVNIVVTPGFDFDVSPRTVLYGAETTFSATTGADVILSSWNFGDEQTATSNGKKIAHRYATYNPEGYTLEVELSRSDGTKAKRTFNLKVGGLNESVTALINEDENRIANVTRQMGSFSPALAESMKKELKIDEINAAISAARASLNNISLDEDYLNIIGELLKVDVPKAISVKEEGNALPLVVGFDSINVDQILEISAVQIESDAEKEQLKQVIVSWFENNYQATIDYKIISRTNDAGDEPILTYVKINVNPKGEGKGAYLILNYPRDSVNFLNNYSEKTTSSGVYIPMDGAANFEFTLSGEVDATNLGIYISPEASQVYESFGLAAGPQFSWGRFFFGMFLLLFAAFAVYIALQEWYKRRYESHLFKNQNDLYNLLSFISNSRKGNVKDEEIKKKLSASKWKGEQIDYSFRKIDAKRTGMWEIPIFRFFEKRKIEKELAKRQAPQINVKKEQGLLKS